MARKGCSGSSIPAVQLAFEKRACLRGGARLQTPALIAAFVQQSYGCKPQELVLSLSFNSHNELLNAHEVALGGIAQAPVDPKVLFAGALLSGASALVLVHNHPSGAVEPSRSDVDLTQQVSDGASMLAIKLLDHIIVGGNGAYYSFVEHGAMPPQRRMAGADFGDEEVAYGPESVGITRRWR